MNRTIRVFSFLTLLLLVCLNSRATEEDWNYEKKKNFSKSYPLNNHSAVTIKNAFGNVRVNTWNKKEVKVDVTITVKSNNENSAQSLIDGIQIDASGGNNISFETRIQQKSAGRNSKTSIQINYEVYMPESVGLSLVNKFGNIQLPDWSGSLSIDQAYGDVTTGALNEASSIKVEYGKLLSKKLKNASARLKFSSIKIDRLSGDFSGDFDLCDHSSIALDESTRNVAISGSYTSMNFKVSGNINAAINIETRYSDFQNATSINFQNQTAQKRYGPSFTKKYSGSSGNGKNAITISSKYGDIKFY